MIGNSAGMLNGAPVTTQDIDLLIRDTRLNRRKLARFAEEIGGGTSAGLRPQRVAWIEVTSRYPSNSATASPA